MLNELQIFVQNLNPRVPRIEYVDSLISLVDRHSNRLHKFVFSTPFTTVSTNRIVMIRHVEVQRIVFDGTIDHRYFKSIPSGFRCAEMDLVSTVIAVDDSNRMVIDVVRIGGDQLELGFDGISSGFSRVAVVVHGGEGDVVLDACHYFAR